MSCLRNFLLYLFQLYSIFNGFSYIYFNKVTMKLYMCVKIYVYSVNIIYTVLIIHFYLKYLTVLIRSFRNDFNSDCLYIILYFFRILNFIGFVWLRKKEEISLKKCFKICLILWKTYYNKLSNISVDIIMEILKFINIFVIFIHAIYIFYKIIMEVYFSNWPDVIDSLSNNFFIAIENYIMLHHSLILSYMNNCFAIINYQLKYENILQPFANIYLQLAGLLKEINILKGPLIIAVLICQLMHISLNAYNMFLFILSIIIKSDLLFEEYIEAFIIIILSNNVILYFVICDRVYRTLRKLDATLLEYNLKKHNHEVCTLAIIN